MRIKQSEMLWSRDLNDHKVVNTLSVCFVISSFESVSSGRPHVHPDFVD